MGHIQTFDDLIAFLLRRWKMMLMIAVTGSLAALYLAERLPATYEAAAVIQIEGAAVDQGGDAEGGVPAGQSTAEILQSVEQRLIARENMQAVIARHRLYADAPQLTGDQKIALLRQSVTFQSVARVAGPGPGAAQVAAIIIQARAKDPAQAAEIANDFALGLVNAGNASHAARTREALAFYSDESRRIEAEMTTLDAELAAFRRQNADSLPDARESRLDESNGLETDLRTIERDLAGLEGQKSQVGQSGLSRFTDQRQFENLNQQIAVAEAQRAALLARKAELQAVVAGAAEVDRVLAGFDRRSAQLRAQYDVVSRRAAEAQTASRLAERQQSERIQLLDAAVAPQDPVSGRARKVALAGVLGSLILALVAGFGRDLLRPVVRTAAQMERELDLRPLVSIPSLRPARAGG